MAVIWNPSIRKTVLTTVVPCESCRWNDFVFGVCHNTLDPKIVKITENQPELHGHNLRVEVFSLSLGVWRSPLSNTCPRESISVGSSQAVVDGFIYWDASEWIKVDGVHTYLNLIMSFDLTSEEFTELYLPNSRDGDLYVSNLRDSLGVFEYYRDTHRKIFNIWIMKGRGCTRSFEKLYQVNTSNASISMTRRFRTSGAFIVEVKSNQIPVTLVAYEPESKDITEIWRDGMPGRFCVHSYVETLLLLGH